MEHSTFPTSSPPARAPRERACERDHVTGVAQRNVTQTSASDGGCTGDHLLQAVSVTHQELVQRVVKGVIARSREPVNSRERAGASGRVNYRPADSESERLGHGTPGAAPVWGCCSHAGVFNTN
jgi:hypothetical protein